MKLILLLFSSLKFGKLLSTGGTMIVSVVMYAFVYGWKYAVGFVGLIFVHEMGHYLAAKQKGLDVGAPVFIPFVGAWIALKEMPRNAEMEAYIGFAGPLVGTVGALACYFVAREWNSALLLAISYSGFFLNLFNLIPVPPLDGGRITAVLSPRIWVFGLPILVAMFIYHPNPMLVIIAILAIPQVWRSFKTNEDSLTEKEYYDVALETKIMYGTYYLVLLIFLAMMVDGVHQLLPVR